MPVSPIGSELAPCHLLPIIQLRLPRAVMGRKSRSARRSRESPAITGEAPAGPAARSRAVSALSRELADFLVEFSIVLHNRSMYPPGHPHLQDSADRFVRRMSLLLKTRETVSLGVARHRLVIEEV